MKRILVILILCLGVNQFTNAQINYGIKGGLNYNDNGDATFMDAGVDIINGAKSKAGFHAGMWLRAKIPFAGIYIRPELVYTQVKSEYEYKNVITEYDFKKLDVPVLFGKKILRLGNVFIGPSFQYILDDDFKFSNISTDDFDKFSVGMQMGFGVEFGKIGIDVRWERGLSKSDAKFIDLVTDTNIIVDNRTNQIIFGVSIKL